MSELKMPFGGSCPDYGSACSLLLGEQIGGLVLLGLILVAVVMSGAMFGLDDDYRKWRVLSFGAAVLGLAGCIWFGLFLAEYWHRP